MKGYNFLCLALILMIAISAKPSDSQSNDNQYNFTLRLNIGSWDIDGLLANFIKSSLQPLKINVEVSTEGDWFGKLGTDGELAIHSWFYGRSHAPSYKLWTGEGAANFAYQYDNPIFLEQLFQETGLTYQDIVNAEEAYLYASSRSEGVSKFHEFVEFFNENLLLAIPLIDVDPIVVSYNASLQGYSTTDGLFGSIYKGLKFTELSNKTTLKLPLGARDSSTYNSVNSGKTSILGSMFLIDNEGSVHPYHVKQVNREDWEMGNGTVIGGGKFTFDFYRNITMGFDYGSPPGWEPYEIGPRDYLFTIQMYDYNTILSGGAGGLYADNMEFKVDDEAHRLEIYAKHPVASFLEAMNTIPLHPHRYLNTTLTYRYNENITGTPAELFEQGISVYDTLEWLYYAIYTRYGATGGPYEYIGVFNGSRYSELRKDFHFPNEWDTNDFLLYTPEQEEAYFFTYNATVSEPHQKPTQLHIQKLKEIGYSSYHGVNSSEYFPYYQKENQYQTTQHFYLDLLQDGIVDHIALSPYRFGKSTDLTNHLSNGTFTTEQIARETTTGDYLWIDVNNEHLKKLNVRKAIAFALDRDEVLSTLGQFSLPVNVPAPVYRMMQGYYTDEYAIPLDYPKSRDYMRSEGYIADDSNFYPSPNIPVETILVTLSVQDTTMSIFAIILPLAVITYTYRLRKRR